MHNVLLFGHMKKKNLPFSAAGAEFRDNLLTEIMQVWRQTLLRALTTIVPSRLKTP